MKGIFGTELNGAGWTVGVIVWLGLVMSMENNASCGVGGDKALSAIVALGFLAPAAIAADIVSSFFKKND